MKYRAGWSVRGAIEGLARRFQIETDPKNPPSFCRNKKHDYLCQYITANYLE